MTEALYTSRRDFLGAGSALIVTGLAHFPLQAVASQQLPTFGGRQALVLYRDRDPHARAFADTFAAAGLATLALTDDPVRLWRDGLGRLFTNENYALLGLGNWSDYTVLRGLAAEHRRFPLLEQRHVIGTSSAWAGELASRWLEQRDQRAPQLALAQPDTETRNGMFSWLF